MIGVPFDKMTPKIGLIGAGARGTLLLRNLLAMNIQVAAVCDVVKSSAAAAGAIIEQAGQSRPSLYMDGDHVFEKLVERDDVNLIVIATPWDWHVPMALAAMRNGKHVALEVPAATTIEDCWKLVDMSEQTRRHCVMLENCCYGYNELLLLRMTNAGVLGDLLFAEGAYIHDLRKLLFSEGGLWRREGQTRRNGNLYPTHGLGPIANYMRINRGDRFDYIVSMSSPERGLDAYRRANISEHDPAWRERYVTGDVNTSLIKTVNGLTITLKYSFTDPFPYSRVNTIAGTKGIFTDFPARLYVEDPQKKEEWETIDSWKAQYQHPLWKNKDDRESNGSQHRGMDYIMLSRLMACMKEGREPDMDVYDAASWSAPGPLSNASLQQRGGSVDFPDFTRGRWKARSASNLTVMI